MRHPHQGHTLIELVVVMGIAAGAGATVLPQLAAGRSALEMHASARELAAVLRVARADAVSRQREVAWQADADGAGYRVGQPERRYRLPGGVRLRPPDAPAEIRFFADGSSTGGRIALAAGERRSVVEVELLSGRVRVRE